MQETQETWVWSLGREDALEEEMATHYSVLSWRIPWTEETGGCNHGIAELDTTDWAHTHTEVMLLLLLLSHFSCVWLCVTPETAAHRLPCTWNSPGKNTGVGCHFLLQCMKVKSESEVARSCPTLCNPIDGSPPGSPIPGVLQARTLEWVKWC